ITLSIEVLPAPFGPMIARISPLRTSNETSVIAFTPPNASDTFSTARMVSPAAILSPVGALIAALSQRAPIPPPERGRWTPKAPGGGPISKMTPTRHAARGDPPLSGGGGRRTRRHSRRFLHRLFRHRIGLHVADRDARG